jgi:hypothetical protein
VSRRRALAAIVAIGGTLGLAGAGLGTTAVWALLALAALLAGIAEIGSG